MKSTLLSAIAVLGTLAASPGVAHADSFASSCNRQTLNVGVKMVQDPFFRQFHNQDLVQSINQLRTSAETDRQSGNLEACGIKATTISAIVKDPGHARVTLADYRSRQAAASGAPVVGTHSVAPGRHFSQEELMGTSLRSLNNEQLGTITGIVYSQTGQPLYITLTPRPTSQAAGTSMMVPVGLLLVGNMPGTMYVSLNSGDFWNEPRFRAPQTIDPAG